MTKSDTIIELKKQKIVAVIRGNTKEEGLQASIACIKGGIKAIEIAYTNQYAGQIIKELVDLYQDDQSVCIGAGTVLDAVTARDAILAEQITLFLHLSMLKLRKCAISTAHRTFQAVLPSQRSRLHLKPVVKSSNSSQVVLSVQHISLQSRHRSHKFP